MGWTNVSESACVEKQGPLLTDKCNSPATSNARQMQQSSNGAMPDTCSSPAMSNARQTQESSNEAIARQINQQSSIEKC